MTGSDQVQQVADDREGNSHAEPESPRRDAFHRLDFAASSELHSLKVWHDDLLWPPTDHVPHSVVG